jgi:membrane-bound lytic murein transglycosylase D
MSLGKKRPVFDALFYSIGLSQSPPTQFIKVCDCPTFYKITKTCKIAINLLHCFFVFTFRKEVVCFMRLTNGFCSGLLLVGLCACVSTEPTEEVSELTAITPEETLSEDEAPNEGVIPIAHPENEVTLVLPSKEEIDNTPLETTLQSNPNDLWQRVSRQFAFDIPEQRRITNQKNWYLKHPEYMKRVMKRASPFVYFIVEEIEKREMPLELALLPIVESAFDPFAYSHGRAAGMWQFIPGTATRFGMKQTWWYDGRRDVIASTQGALDYLNYLHRFFDGNWLHALAAYNSGEGRVRKAIQLNEKKGKSTDFWSLDLPRETRAYVPKLLALADIVKNHDAYKFDWPEIKNEQVVEIVEIGSQIDLALAAELSELDVNALHALNPGFNRWATDPDGPHRLLLPVSQASVFSDNLAQTSAQDRLNWIRHTIKSGDSLLKLANQYHTTADIIKQVNELNSNVIIAGDHLMVPVALKSLSAYALSNEERLAAKQNRKRGDYKFDHTVVSGDTLWDISRKYDVSVKSLAKWNGLAPRDTLKLGQELVVWVDKASDSTREDAIIRKVSYQVRKGDSLSRIASKFNVKTKDIVKWNSLNPKRYLQPGQTLILHIDVTRSAS